MQEAVLSPLAAWYTVYSIVGTVATTLTGLQFIGIRNAWDVVTYMTIERAQPQNTSQD